MLAHSARTTCQASTSQFSSSVVKKNQVVTNNLLFLVFADLVFGTSRRLQEICEIKDPQEKLPLNVMTQKLNHLYRKPFINHYAIQFTYSCQGRSVRL